MHHNVKLDLYEGPIDLLLYLVRRGEIDIYQIPVARIAKEYFEWVRLLEAIDLAAAGEFIAMAVTLLRLKLQMLLPSKLDESEDIQPAVSFSSEEYVEFKELAWRLAQMEISASEYFSRSCRVVETEEHQGGVVASFFDLLSAFKAVMEKERRVGLYTVNPIQISVEERMREILEILKGGERVSFFQLFEDNGRMMLVTTFLAVLELIRVQKIRAIQPEPFGEIWIHLGRGGGATRRAYGRKS